MANASRDLELIIESTALSDNHQLKIRASARVDDAACVEKDIDLIYDEEEALDVQSRDFKQKQVFRGWTLLWLAYQSIGVIYGDIGTSPLYVYSSTFSSEPSHDDLLGALSLIIWSITLIVTVKYVLIVLYANDEGEGGTFAIYSLLSRYCNIAKHDPKKKNAYKLERYASNQLRPSTRSLRDFLENSRVSHAVLKALSVFGVSLVLSDSILTPAQSVLGAVQGLKVVTPGISSSTIIGVSCAILVLLFLLQPLGISRLASCFAPIVVVWLLLNLCFGIYNLATFDWTVLKAFSPYFAGQFLVRNKTDGWISLGGILLCFTGVEALFADMGAFSKEAIQISWLGLAYPCLLLAYIGQAANISHNEGAYSNPFFNTVPPGMLYPSLIISILAAIVASQALITSTFQLLSQVMNMSYFPQIKMIYTSEKFHGQVYIPVANWLMMIGTVIVTAVFNNTTKLGHAYGFCVILVAFITTNLVAITALMVWRFRWFVVLPVWFVFITLDGLFLTSAATKFIDGAWFTFVLAILLCSVFILWRYGKEKQWAAEEKKRIDLRDLIIKDEDGKPRLTDRWGGGEINNIKGLGIFFDKAGDKVPAVYEEFIKKFEAQQDVHVFLHLRALHMPHIPDDERYSASGTSMPNCYRLTIRHGYNDHPVNFDLGSTVYTQLRHALVRAARPASTHSDAASSSPAAKAHAKTSPTRQPAASLEPSIIPGPFDPAHVGLPRATSPAPPSILIDRVDAAASDRSNSSDSHSHSHGGSGKPSHSPSRHRRNSSVRFAGPADTPYTSLPDSALKRRLAALDAAYATQVVYVVGKEELRLMGPGSYWDWWRQGVLGVFLWLRANTRAKVAKMKVPVDKLVEVGFVREL
ncbi:potassium transporter-domain-containing protein [Phyllosticta citrichinensis]|uniref:Potassium transporter-domain-containing protein n=1 Tax=Phyllosticta citrichinensis TaxID=1130410 RepID=A0ABR1XP86_9PEZI